MTAVANRILRAFSLVITDRRWAAPLSAAALGFGLFVGVAIGPSAAGTLAGATQIIEIPGAGSDEGDSEVEATDSLGGLGESLNSTAGGGEGSLETPLEPAPFTAAPAAPPPPERKPAPEPTPPHSETPAEEDEEETELKGIVVHVNPAAGSYALAIKGGELIPIHTRKLPPPGTKLTVTTRRLANGTFAETKPPKSSGKVTRVTFRGVVTFLDPDPLAPAYTVSGRGASILVHLDPDPTGAAPQLPAFGSYVTVTAGIKKPSASAAPQAIAGEQVPSQATPPTTSETPSPEPTCTPDPSLPPIPQIDPPTTLWQLEIEIEPNGPSTYLDLSGRLDAICPETAQILLSADDIGESGGHILLNVSKRINTSKLKLGDSLLATATVASNGTPTLAGLASDEQINGADNLKTAQGDLKG